MNDFNVFRKNTSFFLFSYLKNFKLGFYVQYNEGQVDYFLHIDTP